MRTQFVQPAKLDGRQLLAELNAGGVVATELPDIDSENNFWLDIDPKDEAKATPIIAAHVAIPYVDPYVATRTSGRIHALSLGYTQAQTEVLFP